jgi:proteasome accessory factor A
VGSENGQPSVPYQLTQRGDFFECLLGVQTTHHRPLVNARDESLCGTRDGAGSLARLHVIFYDTTLSQVATYLQAGVTQLIVAMIEAGESDPALILDDPLHALRTWGHDPDLQAKARLADGRELTAVELQLLFLERASAFVEQGRAANVPEAPAILSLWAHTLHQLERRDFDALAPRLDWVMKRRLIERFLAGDPKLTWECPELKQIDLMYASLDPESGLYWALETAGAMARVVAAETVERFRCEPPEDTRAWTRAMLLRALGAEQITRIDWDEVGFRAPTQVAAGRECIVRLDDPTRHNRAEMAAMLTEPLDYPRLLEVFEDTNARESRTRRLHPRNARRGNESPIGLLPPPESH